MKYQAVYMYTLEINYRLTMLRKKKRKESFKYMWLHFNLNAIWCVKMWKREDERKKTKTNFRSSWSFFFSDFND